METYDVDAILFAIGEEADQQIEQKVALEEEMIQAAENGDSATLFEAYPNYHSVTVTLGAYKWVLDLFCKHRRAAP